MDRNEFSELLNEHSSPFEMSHYHTYLKLMAVYDSLVGVIDDQAIKLEERGMQNEQLVEACKRAAAFVSDVTMQSFELGDPDLYQQLQDVIDARRELGETPNDS